MKTCHKYLNQLLIIVTQTEKNTNKEIVVYPSTITIKPFNDKGEFTSDSVQLSMDDSKNTIQLKKSDTKKEYNLY